MKECSEQGRLIVVLVVLFVVVVVAVLTVAIELKHQYGDNVQDVSCPLGRRP